MSRAWDPAAAQFPNQCDVDAASSSTYRACDDRGRLGRDRRVGQDVGAERKSNFSGFAPTKAAQRILAVSIAREFGPKGIHVAYILIDAVIDLEWTRALRPDAPDDVFIQPSDIAEESEFCRSSCSHRTFFNLRLTV